jgi:hypothetical protein
MSIKDAKLIIVSVPVIVTLILYYANRSSIFKGQNTLTLFPVMSIVLNMCLLTASLWLQSNASVSFANLYKIPYYFKINQISDKDIIIDSDILYSEDTFGDPNRLDFNFSYSMQFWGRKDNKYNASGIELIGDNTVDAYYLTNKFLPGEFIDNTDRFLLFSSVPSHNFEITNRELEFNTRGFNKSETNLIWTVDEEVELPVYIPNVKKLNVIIKLAGAWPKELTKEIEIFIEGESIGKRYGTENEFCFSTEYLHPTIIRSLVISSNMWDPTTGGYKTEMTENSLGIDITEIDISYE